MHGFRNCGPALAHDPPIAANASYPVLPSFPVFPGALALIHELSKLGTPVLVFDLGRR
jgi:hypothetical protein